MINHSFSGEMVSLEKHPVTSLAVKKVCQEGHLVVKHCFKPERIYVMSNIVERNSVTGSLCEGVVNSRMVVRVGPVRSISCEILQKRFKLRIGSQNVDTMLGRASEVVETLARRRIDICIIQKTC